MRTAGPDRGRAAASGSTQSGVQCSGARMRERALASLPSPSAARASSGASICRRCRLPSRQKRSARLRRAFGSSSLQWRSIPESRPITSISCSPSMDWDGRPDLPATMALVARYLRPGGCFLVSGEHPVYSCLEWNGTQQHRRGDRQFAEGPSRAHVVEGRAHRHPTIARSAPSSDRSSRRACRSRPWWKRRSMRRRSRKRMSIPRAGILPTRARVDADDVHHQGAETVRRLGRRT